MTITWELVEIKSIDPSTMQITIVDFVDGIKRQTYFKNFNKGLSADVVLTQLAQFIRQSRQKEIDDRLPFNTLDLSNFENEVDL